MKDQSSLDQLENQMSLDLDALDVQFENDKSRCLRHLAKEHNQLDHLSSRDLIYSDLEELARQEAQLLRDMENYKDYTEPNNEDLANKLRDLKFEVVDKEVEECINESDQRQNRRRRKKDKKSRVQSGVEADLEDKRLIGSFLLFVLKLTKIII